MIFDNYNSNLWNIKHIQFNRFNIVNGSTFTWFKLHLIN